MKNNIKAYYNEWDKDAAAWLRQLIKDGLIKDGVVDERSITEVSASDIRGFDRVHWFAGIGTWDYCLNEAGWCDRKVWTASLPCQPFSAAGKQLGKADERHLLPHFLGLVKECRPDVIFGEQVGRAIQHGWLDDLHTEMEAQNYAVGHCVFGAHSIGAAHIRQRLYWVANTKSQRIRGISRACNAAPGKIETSGGHENREFIESFSRGAISGMGITNINGRKQGSETSKAARYRNTVDAASCGMEFTQGEQMGIPRQPRERRETGIDWIACRDGKHRPIKSGIEPLVNGSTRRVVHSIYQSEAEIRSNESSEAHKMRLRGYGNAIVAGCAIEFIKTYMEYKNK